ncbi:endo alpha-1,4 polygalactosaminidase [Streptomyces sp. NPDC058867]|uniref:endo alpha-1,4 polygalactosaminidase n=1 Tax=unclassified Streptomyces TaxID=2593676 RepID=UPI003673D75B
MHNRASAPRSSLVALVVAVVIALAAVVTALMVTVLRSEEPAESEKPAGGRVTPPPVRAGFDYQLGGAYDPPEGVSVVARDRTAEPAEGLYNICYINGFQAQPGEARDWDADLLLRDSSGEVVMDEDWGEAMLDVGTEAKRERIADTMYEWIDDCAEQGFQAVEPDNYDTFARAPRGMLTEDDAKAFLTLLATHAHERDLAIGQKNTPELAPARAEVGVDFAVVEECGQYDECAAYAAEFGDAMFVIEYTDRGMERACEGFGDKVSVVRRDLDLVAEGAKGYHREDCGTT